MGEVEVDVGNHCSVEGEDECGARIWANNSEENHSEDRFFGVDLTPPSIDQPELYEGDRTGNESGSYFKEEVSIRASISDDLSGLEDNSCRVRFDGSGSWLLSGVSQDGDYCYYNDYNPGSDIEIEFNVSDEAGNSNASESSTFIYDDQPPNTFASAVKSDGSSYSFGERTNSPYVDVSLTCQEDGSDCDETYYCVDSEDDCTPDNVYSEPVQISDEGSNYIRFYSEDELGNTESVNSEEIIIDTVLPVVNLVSPENDTVTEDENATFTCNISDNEEVSGLTLHIWDSDGEDYFTNTTSLSGTSNTSSWNKTFTDNDAYEWNCLGEDDAGNEVWSEEGNYSYTFAIFPEMNDSFIEPFPEAITREDLKGYCNAVHDDFDEVGYNYEWYRDGSLHSNGSTEEMYPVGEDVNVGNVSSNETGPEEDWVFGCQAYDNLSMSSWLNSSVTLITDPQVLLESLSPVGDIDVMRDEYFNITLNASCTGGSCGDVDISFVSDGSLLPVGSGSPFYIDESNPETVNLDDGDSELVISRVNATGSDSTSAEFYEFANMTGDNSVSNQTSEYTVTIMDMAFGSVIETDSTGIIEVDEDGSIITAE